MMNQPWNARSQGRKLALGLALSGLTALLAQAGCSSSDIPEFILLPDAGIGTGNNSATGGSSSSGSGGAFGSGGASASGGSFGSGGNSATGGSFGTGGSRATGGTFGSGGNTGSGGQTVTTGSGGARATGGSTGSGGANATGGSTGSGGMTASGGATGSGGMRATGGTTGSGGAKATGGSTGSGGATSGSGGSSGTAPTFTQVYQQILSMSCSGSQCHSPGTQGGVSFSSQATAYNSCKSRVVAGNANSSSLYTLVNGGRMPPGNKLSATLLKLIADWINAGALNN